MSTVRVEYMDERGKGAQSAVLTEIPHGSAAPSPRTPPSRLTLCQLVRRQNFCRGQVTKKGDISNDLRMGTFLMTLDTRRQLR
jgi:hypothetical protein